ncbi:beta-propeller fold lactonase family protein [Geothrix sp.]|uniref:beta-propeller fold lactonase family protein n=1 Tax=Geothrix sp. TaxID=1962974 RepID=UPI0025BBB4BE|nr:beta-propeller fold lactonase family protein [Geothrix sp.]
MSSTLIRRNTFREALVAIALGGLGTLLQIACGGGGGGGGTTVVPPPPAPTITSFAAAKSPITAGASTTLTGVFANGSGTVDKGVGALASGVAVSVSPSTDTTYTLTVTNSAGVPATATAQVVVVPAPTTPAITAPAQVTAGQGGYAATVPAQAGSSYAWTLTNGTVTAGAGTPSILFTAGTAGSVGLSCVVTNAAGTASTAGSASSTIVAAPSTPVITLPATVTAGQGGYTASTPVQAGMTLAWTITNGTITSSPTGASVTFSAGTAGSVALSCVATNGIGATSVAGAASAAIVAPPTSPVITSPANVTAGRSGYTASVPAQAGSSYAWTVTNGTITAGAGTPSITFTAGASGSVGLSCVVTNAAGTPSTAATASAAIVAAPATPVVIAPAYVTAGQTGYTASTPAQAGMSFAWTITNGTITSGSTGASVTFTAGASGSVGLSCVATNAASTAATGTASSAIVAAPATPTVTAPAYVTAGQTGYTASVPAQAGSSYAWTVTNGTVTAGVGTASITFTAGASGSVSLNCVVTNAANTASAPGTASAAIAAAPTAPVITAPANVTAGQAGYTASTPAQSGMSFAWTITNGTITSGSTGASVTFTAGASGSVGLSCVATNAASTAATGTASSAIVAAPATPTVTAPAYVTAGQTGYTASVPAQAGSSYAWTVTNGTVTAGGGTASITFTAGGSGFVTFSCTVTNAANTASAPGAASSTITPAPTTPVLTVPANITANQVGTAQSVPAQSGSSYAWTLTNGSIVSGNGTNSLTFRAGATGTVGFSCTVTNLAGTASAPGTASSAIVPAPTAPVISTPAYVTAGKGGYAASVPAQGGMTLTWTISGGTITSGTTGTTITFSAGGTGSVFLSCKAANAAGASATGNASSAIVPFPTISQLSASPADVASGGASTLSYAFAGGTGLINQGVGAVTSGGSSVVHPTSTTTYTLTVTNPAGDPTTDTVTVTVGALPNISTFKAGPATLTQGQGSLLTFTFTGDGVIDHGVGPVTSGSQIAVFPAATTTYTLTATNAVGATTTAVMTVTVKAFTGKFVYVANSGGGISGFSLNETTGALAELGNSPFDDGTPALHVISDPEGKFLFAVNGDGLNQRPNTLTVFKIDSATGDLTEVAAYPTDPNPWASAVDPTGQFVYVRCDGLISSYGLNAVSGALTPLGSVAASGGTGEVLIHPSGRLLFTVGRTSDQLQVFDLNPATGALSLNGGTTLPTGTGPLALALSHSGEYLFTKSEGAAGGAAQECIVYGYYLDLQTGGLMPLAATDTGTTQADTFHGVSANPTQPVIYITLSTTDNDYAAYALNLVTGALSPLTGSTYALFGGTGSDNLMVSRNGLWGFMTDYWGNRIAVGAIDPATGVLLSPTFHTVGASPVSVAVVGTVQ